VQSVLPPLKLWVRIPFMNRCTVICAVLGLVGCFNNTRYSLYSMIIRLGVSVMVFNAIFNNISAILWQSVLLVKETGVPGENHRSAKLYRCPNIWFPPANCNTVTPFVHQLSRSEKNYHNHIIILYEFYLVLLRNPNIPITSEINITILSYGTWIYDYMCWMFQQHKV
jgi:hypothetical protein